MATAAAASNQQAGASMQLFNAVPISGHGRGWSDCPSWSARLIAVVCSVIISDRADEQCSCTAASGIFAHVWSSKFFLPATVMQVMVSSNVAAMEQHHITVDAGRPSISSKLLFVGLKTYAFRMFINQG